MARLRDWLNNAPLEEDQKILLRLVPQLFFVGTREFTALYRSAFNYPIIRWLINELGLRFDDPLLNSKLNEAIQTTWFCPVTDSMQIAAFYHINNIEGTDLRPDWRTLRAFGDPSKIDSYMKSAGLKRIVLLEDFVGTGSQMAGATNFAANLPSAPPVLVTPLIVAPQGLEAGQLLESTYSHVTFSPVMDLRGDALIQEVTPTDENNLFPLVRELIIRLYTSVTSGLPPDDTLKPYGPFGFNRTTPRIGALLVMYSNCPDNTLPIIHHTSMTWKALFPRSSRV